RERDGGARGRESTRAHTDPAAPHRRPRARRNRDATGRQGLGYRAMKITKIEHLHADAGQRNFDFLKISTDEGLVGWSEYNESFGGLGVSAVIDGLGSQILGKDPTAYEALVTLMYAVRRQAAGG